MQKRVGKMPNPPASLPTTDHRYTALLISLLCLFVLVPWWSDLKSGPILTELVMVATLLAAIYAAAERQRSRYIAILLAASVLSARLLLLTRWLEAAILVDLIAWGLFIAYVAVAIITSVMRARRISFDTISGALCGYLLIGLAWSVLYILCEYRNPRAFALPAGSPAVLRNASTNYLVFVYYSFLTLTTVGYGDITPQLPVARSLAVIEAIIGQFYTAVLVARLVALEILHSSRDSSAGSADRPEG